MTTTGSSQGVEPDLLTEFRHAVARDIMTLAVLHNEELSVRLGEQLVSEQYPSGLQFRLVTARGQEATKLLHDSIQLLGVPIEETLQDELAADYAGIYLTHALRASPCESVWIDEEGLAMQEPMFQVRAAYKRHGLAAPDWRKRPDDHLVLQLQFVSHLFESDAELDEIARFLDEHLLRWLPGFAERVASRSATPFYAGLAAFTAAFVDEVRETLVEVLDTPRPTQEEIEQRLKTVTTAPLPEPEYVPGSAPSW